MKKLEKINIPFARPMIGKEEKSSSKIVLNGNVLTHGKKCRSFESIFSKQHQNFTAVTLANCTSAMFLSLKALNISKGDEVIVHTKMLGGGESDTITFIAPENGFYTYICSFPGHWGLMKGKLIV